MTSKYTLSALIIGLSASAASGVTLEELAARLDSLEKKVQSYESRYGPLEAPKQETIPMPSSSGPQSSVVAAPSGGSGIDDLFLGNSGGNRWYEKTSIGGYGELNLNTGDKDQIDFHRWVLFVNHRFNDRIKLFSEFELEHSLSGDGKPGEVELEQAYIEFDMDQGLSAKAGLFLVPVGLLNETHEPNTFYGVERNNIESKIIPTTWWEGGLSLTKNFDNGVGLDFAVHSGLDVSTAGGSAFAIRSGRQKVAEADATNWAATGRVHYNNGNGLSLSGFANFQSDISSSSAEDNSALLLGASAQYQAGGFGFRALFSHWEIDGASFEAADADSQWGYFLEPSYRWSFENGSSVGVFGRYSNYEYVSGTRKETDEYTMGVNYWPIDNVVLKADYNVLKEDGAADNKTLNFGVGYSF
ncbi:OprO/OprP family phosphate-selective porin [Akkermansiaceae bacterium]|nr:OprO/OprP family phosphate-selective porin [Akkermansiaceae bacterium]